jgi:hypothetical protein
MLYMDVKLRTSALGVLAIVLLLVVSTPALMASAQQPQPQHQSGSSSAVSSICKMVQDNRFLAGIAGLDQAVNICNKLSTGNSGQVLSQLCSVIGGLKIINVESICKQQQQTTTNGTNQNQTLSQGGVVNNNSNNNNNNTNASNSGGSSNSLIDKTMGVLKGYLGK